MRHCLAPFGLATPEFGSIPLQRSIFKMRKAGFERFNLGVARPLGSGEAS
jgi:hypothetical protein